MKTLDPDIESGFEISDAVIDASRATGNWHEVHRTGLTRGERAADVLRNGMGSWTFVAVFVAFMAAWAVANVVVLRWDPYPFILLNLFLSMLAGLQGAILLIAAKRQDAIAAALAQHDFETDISAKIQIEELMEINRRQLELLSVLCATPAGLDLEPKPTEDKARLLS